MRDGAEFFEVKVVAADAEVLRDVGNNSTRHVARMPCEGDETLRMKRIGVVPMTT